MVAGIDLKLERVRKRVTQGELCRELGISRTTLWKVYEAPVSVPADRAVAYLDALTSVSETKACSATSPSATSTAGAGASPSTSGSAMAVG